MAHVRFAPKADKLQIVSICPLARNGLMHRNKKYPYSIASSAMASSPGRGVRLSALAAFDVDDELEGRRLHHR
jgi:hypothetical protein